MKKPHLIQKNGALRSDAGAQSLDDERYPVYVTGIGWDPYQELPQYRDQAKDAVHPPSPTVCTTKDESSVVENHDRSCGPTDPTFSECTRG